jgi:hypothetical protein
MRMMGTFAEEEDPEIANILSGLESVKVRVYNLNGKHEKANSTIDRVSNQLKSDNWETLVTVNNNEDNQKVRVFSKSTEKVIDGVVVMVVSPDKISHVTETFDININ